MARVIIEEPSSYLFNTTLDVYISMVNRGNHLGNESLIALLNEARCRFMAAAGIAKFSNADIMFINADLAVNYKVEGKHGDKLTIEIGIGDHNKYGCDFIYKVTNSATLQTIAIAKTGMLCFDYNESKLTQAPQELWDALDNF